MFYVYELVDPRDSRVFYIGKGQGVRMLQHEKDARKGVHGKKCDLIRSILSSGSAVVANVVDHFDDESQAYQFEAELILKIGLENLTNIIPGGSGSYSLHRDRLKERADRMPLSYVGWIAKVAKATSGFTVPVVWGDPFNPKSSWVDMTALAKEALAALIKGWGREAVRQRLLKHGVGFAAC